MTSALERAQARLQKEFDLADKRTYRRLYKLLEKSKAEFEAARFHTEPIGTGYEKIIDDLGSALEFLNEQIDPSE
jgi:hypothetical protein